MMIYPTPSVENPQHEPTLPPAGSAVKAPESPAKRQRVVLDMATALAQVDAVPATTTRPSEASTQDKVSLAGTSLSDASLHKGSAAQSQAPRTTRLRRGALFLA